MFPQMLDSVSRSCSTCLVELELLENMNPYFNHRIYGCQQCDSVFDFRATTSCTDIGGLTKLKESLTEYKRRKADKPQAEIRLRIAILEQETKTLGTNLEAARKAFEAGQTTYLVRLAEIQKDCTRPHFKTDSLITQCPDCLRWIPPEEIPMAILRCGQCGSDMEHVEGGGHDGRGGFFGCQKCNTIYRKLSGRYEAINIELVKLFKLDEYKKEHQPK